MKLSLALMNKIRGTSIRVKNLLNGMVMKINQILKRERRIWIKHAV
jgi:hypothetical protein